MTHDARWWWVGLAVVSALGLLFSFDRVVRQGMQQGNLRRAAEADRGHALWQCNSLRGTQARADCRVALR